MYIYHKMTYVYIFKERFAFCYKIGISKNVKKRLKRANQDTDCYLVCAFPLFWAYRIEQWLHKVYAHLNTPKEGINGGTEWFYFWLPFRPAFWMLLFFALEWGILLLIILILIWI